MEFQIDGAATSERQRIEQALADLGEEVDRVQVRIWRERLFRWVSVRLDPPGGGVAQGAAAGTEAIPELLGLALLRARSRLRRGATLTLAR